MLILPYLPFIADAFPPLQMLGGPARVIVWLAVAGQLCWVLARSGMVRAGWASAMTPGRAALMLGAATLLVSGIAASRLTGTVLFPSGDEPHYLVIAQSLWRDGDLKIANNHQRLDYKEYFAPDLEPDYLTRGADGEIYSIHPVGMPVLMAPVYAAGGYRGVVAAFVLLAATAAALMTFAIARTTGAVGAAAFAWAAIALTAPFLFNSFAIYPEIPAALAVVLAFTFATGMIGASPIRSWLVVGLACAALPWLSTKYAPMSAALVVVALGRLAWPLRTEGSDAPSGSTTLQRALVPVLAIVLPYVVSLAGWFAFFDWIWGTPSPRAPYGALVQTELFNLTFGAPGPALRSGVRTASLRAGVRAGGDRLVAHVARRRRLAAHRVRNRPRLRRAPRHRGRVPDLVGRHGVAGPADHVGSAAARVADGRRLSRGARRQRAARGAAPAALAQRRHRRHHALRRTGLPDQPTAATARRACSSISRRGGRRGRPHRRSSTTSH